MESADVFLYEAQINNIHEFQDDLKKVRMNKQLAQTEGIIQKSKEIFIKHPFKIENYQKELSFFMRIIERLFFYLSKQFFYNLFTTRALDITSSIVNECLDKQRKIIQSNKQQNKKLIEQSLTPFSRENQKPPIEMILKEISEIAAEYISQATHLIPPNEVPIIQKKSIKIVMEKRLLPFDEEIRLENSISLFIEKMEEIHFNENIELIYKELQQKFPENKAQLLICDIKEHFKQTWPTFQQLHQCMEKFSHEMIVKELQAGIAQKEKNNR